MNAVAAVKLPGSAPVSATPLSWAETYDNFAAMEDAFTPFQVNAMALERRHTVLDVGAGSGRLSLPVAQRVTSVTALDNARPLLDRLDQRARESGQKNITALEKDWDTLDPLKDLPRHDVVIASRYTGEQDLLKLNDAANEFVYLVLFAGPSTRAIHSALLEGIAAPPAEEPVERSGVLTVMDEISALGIEPNLVHVPDGFVRWFRDEREAYASFGWLGVDPSLQPVLNGNIRRFLQQTTNGGVRFAVETRSAVIWWRKA